jgi:hypothetical protein
LDARRFTEFGVTATAAAPKITMKLASVAQTERIALRGYFSWKVGSPMSPCRNLAAGEVLIGLNKPAGGRSMVNPVHREDVIAILGLVDDLIVAKIIGMGATASELAEARAWIANDEALMNEGRPLAGGRVEQLIEMIRDLEKDEEKLTQQDTG